ncbi:MAG: hypothetical protein D3908_11365 [Candidatus Electrothrix sp. AUS4]|nr:hypothetical protein [Candidatus Electrothrix sp. AUS4]
MTVCEQKLYAFERSVQIIEEFSQTGGLSISDKSFQALYNTHKELVELFSGSDESPANAFLVPQI